MASNFAFLSSSPANHTSHQFATMDVQAVRSQFPALHQEHVFFDNAGGSQVLGTVVASYVDFTSRILLAVFCCLPPCAHRSPRTRSISNHLINSNVQLGATSSVGKQASAVRHQPEPQLANDQSPQRPDMTCIVV